MSYQQKDNSGSLFRNEEKTNERGPDYSGTCMVGGVEYFFDGWLKTADSGRKWMSFSFKAKTKQPVAPQKLGGVEQARRAYSTAPADDSDVPF